jgi:diadenosine tetraphosphate (Ap4A) HIT family hydrolase
MTEPPCPFCTIDPTRILHESGLVRILRDGFPVSPGHLLLVPRRHIVSWFDATPQEQHALTAAIAVARSLVEQEHQPDGYNVGMNLGEAAGQTVMHLHLHVIPRYRGDVASPRGGVRHVIPAKADYRDRGA